MSRTRFVAAVALAGVAAMLLTSCAPSPVPAMDREQTAEDEVPPQVTWPEGEATDLDTSRLLGQDRDGREYYVTRSTGGVSYCLTVVPAAGKDGWVTACGTMPLTAGLRDVGATLVSAGEAEGGDEIVGGQVVVTYRG